MSEEATPPGLRNIPSAGDLETWARYWVASPHAKLQWDLVYNARRPRKVPLPAYPFELTRVWYTVGSGEQMPVETAPASPANKLVRDAVRGATAERPWIASSSAIAGLAVLLEHVSAKASGRSFKLGQIVFGPPIDIAEPSFTCRATADKGAIVQCLCERNGKRAVLVQARLVPGGNHVRMDGRRPERMTQVAPSEFYARAEEAAPGIDPHHHCVIHAERGDQSFCLKTSLSWRAARDRHFWNSFFSVAYVASLELLKDGVRAGVPVPYRASSVTLAAEACRGQVEIRAVRSRTEHGIDIIGLDERGRLGMLLSGLELRQGGKQATAAFQLEGEGAAAP